MSRPLAHSPRPPSLTILTTDHWSIVWMDPGAEGTIVHIIENHISAATAEIAAPDSQADLDKE